MTAPEEPRYALTDQYRWPDRVLHVRPELGFDVAAVKTTARRDGDDYVISGQKMWLTNGSSNLVALLARTDERGALSGQDRQRWGYKGVDATELVLDGCRVPASRAPGHRVQAG